MGTRQEVGVTDWLITFINVRHDMEKPERDKSINDMMDLIKSHIYEVIIINSDCIYQ